MQGAAQISSTSIPYVKIFIMPPSMKILRERLIKRNTDSLQEIVKRLLVAKQEIKFIPQYDYLIVNDELSVAVEDVLAIIRGEENRTNRYPEPIKDFLEEE